MEIQYTCCSVFLYSQYEEVLEKCMVLARCMWEGADWQHVLLFLFFVDCCWPGSSECCGRSWE